ncbi:hypothetical protein NQ317_000332 [Molorchus minor]|uniref:Uncharacterized protein n=1 Tax=Molorchus minor TaxID=1323400 RepID=A0ABQ9K0Y1_9CUCU|nr:hypothetical protein NQ317_000332 [Molorchus minor]
MYYLSKFCRICVQTGVKLLDLDTLDFDEVKLSEKLEACTKNGCQQRKFVHGNLPPMHYKIKDILSVL